MANYREKIYLDSNIIIAFLMGENESDRKAERIAYCMRRVVTGEIKALSSSEIYAEILEGKCPTGAFEKIKATIFRRRNYEIVGAIPRIHEIAGEIRNRYAQGGRKITAPDATHLATAIYYEVDAFYTWDDGKKGGASLLSLDGNVTVYGLHICKPPLPKQTVLL